MKSLVLLAALVAPLAAAAPAQTAEQAMADRLVNDPRVAALEPYGQPIPPVVRDDKGVQFGKMLRVPVSSPSAEAGRVGAITRVLKPVKAGDRIVIAFWARAHKTEGGAPGRIGRVQLEATPVVRAIFEQPFEVTPEWKMYKLTGVADRDYPPRGLNAAFHLAGAKQVIDLGPVFVLDYGRAAK